MNNEISEYKNNMPTKGKIIVKVFLDSLDGDKMEGIKINLYRINGVSPLLECSKITDPNGIVIFDNLNEGSYRVIELVNKEIYQKPIYSSWNEVNISSYMRESVVNVINKER